MSQDLDAYLGTILPGGAVISPIQLLQALGAEDVSVAEPNNSTVPQMAFKFVPAQVETLHGTNIKYQGIMSFSDDGTILQGLNYDSLGPLLVKAVVTLNANITNTTSQLQILRGEFEDYVASHP